MPKQLTDLTLGAPATGDQLIFRDVSDLTDGAGGTDKRSALESVRDGNIVADKAAAVALLDALATAGLLTASNGRKISIASADGGDFYIRTGAALATYADDGGSFCGTQIIPTGGDGSAGLVRPYEILYTYFFGHFPSSTAAVNDAAWQAAIDLVIDLGEAAGHETGLPRIAIKGGKYSHSAAINTKPWIKICSEGTVYLDWSTAAVGVNGIVCDNDTTIPYSGGVFTQKFAGNNSPFLDGAKGTIFLVGPGEGTSTGSALKLGNYSAGLKPFRLARVRGVQVSDWYAAQEFGQYDTYLIATHECHFEGNTYSIRTQSGSKTNSGERISWTDCTFAASTAVLYNDIDGFDAVFINCSFDFNTSIVEFGSSGRFTDTKFIGCHMEAIDEYVVNASAVVSSIDTAQIAIWLSDVDVLPSAYQSGTIVNSPTRTLFIGPITISFSGIKRDSSARPYLEDGYLIDDTSRLIGYYSEARSGFGACQARSAIINEDHDLQYDPVATVANVLTYWDLITETAITTRDIQLDVAKQVLRLVGSDAVTSIIAFRGTNAIPCRPGDRIFISCAAKLGTATGDTSCQSSIEFFDAASVSLGIFPASSVYNLRDAFNDATLPNFGDGGDRYMSSTGFLAIAPDNAVSAKPRFVFSKFLGTIYVSRMRAWRG